MEVKRKILSQNMSGCVVEIRTSDNINANLPIGKVTLQLSEILLIFSFFSMFQNKDPFFID